MTSTQVAELIRFALSQSKDPRVDDVTQDSDGESRQIILTTDDGSNKQVWVIDPTDFVETDFEGQS
jgi:hypothetical protein